METLKCRNCGAALEAARIDRRLGVVSCAHCGGLHELEAPSPSGTAAGAGTTAAGSERSVAAKPDRLVLERRGDGCRISWAEGSRGSAVVLALFAVVWVVMTVSGGAFFLAPVALPILYYAAVRAINRNRLRADRAGLALDRGPLPWGRSRRRVARAEIAQVYARERVSRTHVSEDGRQRVQTRRRYGVCVEKPDGERVTLVGGFSRPGHALWLEQEIERTLGLEDRRVGGDYVG